MVVVTQRFGYAQRVRKIIAVEHDRVWINKVSQRLPSNGQIVWKELRRRYAEEIVEHGLFDVVVIDGRDRAECATPALNTLKPVGVIVLDNSDRRGFAEVRPLFEQRGYRELGFVGLGPINRYNWKTSVLYRDDKCLGL